MPEPRPHKRLRRQITETSTEGDEDGSGDFMTLDHDTIEVKSQPESHQSPSRGQPSIAMSRPRRSAAPAISSSPLGPSVTVSRSPSGSPEERRKSIKLNFKMPSSKLREVTGLPDPGAKEQKKNGTASSRTSFQGGEIVSGPRSSRTQKKVVEYNEDDDEDEEEDEEEEEFDDAEGEDEEMDDFDTVGAEAEGGTDDDDTKMKDAPTPAPTKVKFKAPNPPAASTKPPAEEAPKPTPKAPSRPAPKGTAAAGNLKPVEDKEMELDPEDDELSEVDEDDEEEDDEEEEDEDEEEDVEDEEEDEEDADGEVDEEMNDTTLPTIVAPEDDEEIIDSEDELNINPDGSRASTPDYARLTKRQRGTVEEEGSFLALPMEPQIKKHFTAEEHRMRRAEMARRRKNLSEKRNEEEKMTTINKLLKKQTTKKRGKAMKPETLAAAEAGSGARTPAENATATAGEAEDDESAEEEQPIEKPNSLYVRWISSSRYGNASGEGNNGGGVKLGVPEEWMGKKVGSFLEKQVQEVK